jgi:tRNA(adenine34) deaminase
MEESSKDSILNADQDERFMRMALREATAAEEAGDVPIGAVIVVDGQLIGKAHNQREVLQDPTAHAEMIALTQAAEMMGSWRLDGCTIYVTLEPCPMCAGALVLGRVARLVYGCDDPKAGACGSLYDIVRDARLNHRLEVRKGVLAQECGQILSEFFRRRRAENGANGGKMAGQ